MLYLFFFYVFMAPLEIYQDRIPKLGHGLNYVDVTMTVMGLWWLARGTRRGRRLVGPSPLNKILAFYVVDMLLGIFMTWIQFPEFGLPFDPLSYSFTFLVRYANNCLFFLLAVNMIDKRQHARWVLYAIGLSTVLVWRAFRSDIAGHDLTAYRDDMRMCMPFTTAGSNELAALFLYVGVFLGTFAAHQKRFWEKACYILATSLYAYCLLFSYSRGSQLGCVVVIALLAITRYRWLLAIIALAAFTYQAWLPSSVVDRWNKTTDEKGELDASAQSREDFWKVAWELFQKSPVVGNGVNSFIRLSPYKMDTHNLYMRVLAEQGAIGIAIIAMIWGAVLRMAFQVWRGAPNAWDRHFGLALMAATIGLIISNIFGDRFTYTPLIGQYWVLAGLCQRLHNNMTGVEPFQDEEASPSPAGEPAEAAGTHAADVISPMFPAPANSIANPLAPSLRPLLLTGAPRALNVLAPKRDAAAIVTQPIAAATHPMAAVAGQRKASAWKRAPALGKPAARRDLWIVGKSQPTEPDEKKPPLGPAPLG